MAHCDDFERTTEATRGAGLSRRQVLGWGLGAGLSIYAARAMPFTRVLEAARAQGDSGFVLVSVFLPGGMDLLDTLIPLDQYGAYADLRPAIKQSSDPLAGASVGLHPALTTGANGGIRGLFGQGKIGFLPGIDYANPDLSHFHSRHFWQSGLITRGAASGWLGRWLDRHGTPENPLQGVTMDYGLSPVLRGGTAPVAAVTTPTDAQLQFPGLDRRASAQAMAAWRELAARRPGLPGRVAAGTAARLATGVADRLAPLTPRGATDPLAGGVSYPGNSQLADRLRHLAGLLAQPLGIRIASVDSAADFDTHDSQASDLSDGLADASDALSAFQADLEQRGIADRVLTFVWTEFGRRPKQNDNNGTDHGAGGLAWVMGTRAKAGILTPYPNLKALDGQGNLAVTADFRAVYASLLEQWLGTDGTEVIPDAAGAPRVAVVA
jgi:uncharacterized protein (DUF1501 family)